MRTDEINYSEIKYELTNALRTIEKLIETQQRKQRSNDIISEEEYWVSTLEVIRMGLYNESNVSDEDLRNSRTAEALAEIREEMTAFLTEHKLTGLSTDELKSLSIAWSKCKKAEEKLS